MEPSCENRFAPVNSELARSLNSQFASHQGQIVTFLGWPSMAM